MTTNINNLFQFPNATVEAAIAHMGLSRTSPELEAAYQHLENDHRLYWVPFGGHESNWSTIGMTSDHARVIVERPTNMFDGVFAQRAVEATVRGEAMPRSPREASEQWFGHVGGHPLGSKHPKSYNRAITMSSGAAPDQPCIWFRDKGIGMTPQGMISTILSLHYGNKISIPYLAGVYGHGAATTLGGSPRGTLIISRHRDSDRIGITVVRYREPQNSEKMGMMEYLVMPDGSIPSVRVDKMREWDLRAILAQVAASTNGTWDMANPRFDLVCDFKPGTLVVHFDYQLPGFKRHIWYDGSHLRNLLNASLFAPVLPYRIVDLRPPKDPQDSDKCTVHRRSQFQIGAYGRLENNWAYPEGHRNKTVSYRKHVVHQFQSTVTGRTELVGINCWVVNQTKTYMPNDWNVVFTAGGAGQTVHYEGPGFFNDRRKLHLSSLDKKLIIQVDLDLLSHKFRHGLVDTSRLHLSTGHYRDELYDAVKKALDSDEGLHQINKEQQRVFLSSTLTTDAADLAKQFKGLTGGIFHNDYDYDTQSVPQKKLPPLPTRDDGPTFVEVDGKGGTPDKNLINAFPGKIMNVRLASDAPDGYQGVTATTFPLGSTDTPTTGSFEGGRLTLGFRVSSVAAPGEKIYVSVSVVDPNGSFITLTAYAEVPKAPKPDETGGHSNKTTRKIVPKKQPIPVYRKEWSAKTGPYADWDQDTIGAIQPGKDVIGLLVNVENARFMHNLAKLNAASNRMKVLRNDFLYVVAAAMYDYYTRTGSKHIPQEVLEAVVAAWIVSNSIALAVAKAKKRKGKVKKL